MKKIISPLYKIKDHTFELANILSTEQHLNQLIINYRLSPPKYSDWMCGNWAKPAKTKRLIQFNVYHHFIIVDNIHEEIDNIKVLQNKFDKFNKYKPFGKILQNQTTARFTDAIELSVINDIRLDYNSCQIILETYENDIKIGYNNIDEIEKEKKSILDIRETMTL